MAFPCSPTIFETGPETFDGGLTWGQAYSKTCGRKKNLDRDISVPLGCNEFWVQYSMRLQVLIDYFKVATPTTLSNQYCDLSLLSFARCGGRGSNGWKTAYVVAPV